MKKIILSIATAAIALSSYSQEGKKVKDAPQQATQPAPTTPQRPMQNPMSPEERGNRALEHMTKNLELTKEQQEKLKPIVMKREAQREEFRKKMDALREEQRTSNESVEKEIKALLTPEQAEKMNGRGVARPQPQPAPQNMPPIKESNK